MNNKTKMIAAGALVAILLVLVVYLNFFSTPTAPPVSEEVQKAVETQIENAKANQPPPPDLSSIPEQNRKPGGKSSGK